MKKIILSLITAFVSMIAMAQFPGIGAAGGKGQAAPSIGHIYGKLVDSSGKSVSDASVILLQNRLDSVSKKRKDFLLKAVTTGSNGEFSLEDLPIFGQLKLKISATGFKTLEQNVSFQMPKPAGGAPTAAPGGMPAMPSFDKDLGKLVISTEVNSLAAVTVNSTKPLMKLDIDKKVFNVEKNIVSAGGTGLDVIKNVPSLNVDIDGNVTLRNAAPQLMIDGRPTTLTLDQIPADAIESVEVITNPSAKYDASGGGAGILNIVLKKNRKTGYNGNLRAGIDKRGAVNGGGDFNVRQGKLNLAASLMVNQNKGVTSGTTDRLNLATDPQVLINQDNYNKTKGGFMFGKLGVDYFITNRTTLSLSGVRVHGEFKPNETIDIDSSYLFDAGKISKYSNRISNSKRVFNGGGLVFGMKHIFPKEGEEITVDANYFGGKNNNDALYTTNILAGLPGSDITSTSLQKIQGHGSDQNFVIQSDYVKPLTSKTKLETGVRAALRSRVNVSNNYYFDYNTNEYILQPSAATNYSNKDNVYAAYATVTSSIKDFGYKIGLRAESSNYSGQLEGSAETFKNSYPISLFPSIFLSQKLKSNQELQISYTRRINRPNFFQLIPIADSTDKLNITKGNPGLVPEFTQSTELSYLKTYGGSNTFLASVYYKYTNHLITRYLGIETDPVSGHDVYVNTYINANSSYSAGLELTGQNKISKWWDLSSNVNIYNSKINTDNIGTGTSQPALWSWFGKLNNNFKLPSKFVVQLTATYQSKTNLPVNDNRGMMGPPGFGQAQSSSQGYIAASWGTDIAIKKTFLKNDAASITLSVNDIFRTRTSLQHSESSTFIQDYSRIRDPQMFRINFSYRFGKMDVSLFKRKSNGAVDTGAGMQ